MWSVLGLAFGTAICSILTYAIYNLYFHPLRNFPGPLLWRAFGIPRVYSAVRGQLPRDVLRLHKKYGTVVRTAPNDLAFAEPQAWQDIYGLQPGRVQNRKDRFMYPIQDPTQDGSSSHDIIFGADAQHARLRRLLGPAFTPAATKNLGPMIESYVDLLVTQLKKVADGEQIQDMSRWFEWATFDMMGEFAFGESFKCLETSSSHLFVNALFQGVDVGGVLGQLERYKFFTLLWKTLPRSVFKIMDDMDSMVRSLSEKRQARGYVPGATDIFNHLLQNKGEDAFTQQEYNSNTLTLLFAGADTSATVMIFGSYLLCLNPDVAKRVKDEVRGAFKDSSEITASGVNALKYMVAVLSEVMRLYPPGPTGLARHIVSETGQSVAGHHVPQNTSCAVYQLAANRLEVNFARPTEFLPERWFDDAPKEFANDRKDIYQPFSFGPRSCIGKPLAYMETRILMAKFLYNFDFELADPNDGWESRTKAFGAWNHSGLKLRLRAAPK